MSERFVLGFTLAPGALDALVGSRRPLRAVLSKAPRAVRQGIEEQFEYDSGGELTPAAIVQEILSGELDREHAYEYARVVELLASAVGKPLGTIEVVLSYSLPNDSAGRWNPVLKQLGLPALAKAWAAPNLRFPWAKRVREKGLKRVLPDWPFRTVLDTKALSTLSRELASPWRARLDALGAKWLVDRHDEWLEELRAELGAGLATLARWVKAARGKRQELLLIMDGDQ